MSFKLENGQYGHRAVLVGEWTPELHRALLRQPISEMELNRGKGWHGRDLSFLAEFPELLGLSIVGRTAEDESPIHVLHNLRLLNLQTYSKTGIRFGEFPNLIECALEWRPKSTSLFDCVTLRKLFLKGFRGLDMEPFGNLKHLESLAILGSGVRSLEGLGRLVKLRSLRLGDMRKLPSLRGIDRLELLEKLEIITCRKIRSIQHVASLVNLRELYLDNLGDIESLRPLQSLTKLTRLTFVESTNVVDGDLTPLLTLPALKVVSFRNRKHYSHTRECLSQVHRLPANALRC